LLIIPIIVNFLPSSWQDHTTKYLPSNLGASMLSPTQSSNSFAWGTATIVLVIYTAVIIAAGTTLMTRRDA